MTYNSTRELQDRLTFLSNRDAWDLKGLLETAHRRVKSKFGREIQQKLHQEVENQKEFKLNFSELLEFNRVQYNEYTPIKYRNEEVDPGNYSVDLDEGIITFEDSFANDKLNLYQDYRLVVYYVPQVFKDLELYYAMQEVVGMNMVETNDQETTNRLQQLNGIIKSVVSDIQRSMPPFIRK